MLSFHWICLSCHVQNALIEACLFMATIKETSRTAPSTSRESYALIAVKTHALLLFPMIPFLSAVSFDDIVSILSDSTDHLIIELSHIYYFIVKLGNCPIDELLIYKKFSRKLYFSFQTT